MATLMAFDLYHGTQSNIEGNVLYPRKAPAKEDGGQIVVFASDMWLLAATFAVKKIQMVYTLSYNFPICIINDFEKYIKTLKMGRIFKVLTKSFKPFISTTGPKKNIWVSTEPVKIIEAQVNYEVPNLGYLMERGAQFVCLDNPELTVMNDTISRYGVFGVHLLMKKYHGYHLNLEENINPMNFHTGRIFRT